MSFTNEQIAQVAHNATRALQSQIDDTPLPPWPDLGADLQEAATATAAIARYGAPPAAVHDAWVRAMLQAGWTVGDVRDTGAKTDPAMVAFDSLTPTDQARDYLICGVSTAMNAAANVRTRAENDALALQEAEQLVSNGGGNRPLQPGSLPFGGMPPVFVELQPQQPATPEEA